MSAIEFEPVTPAALAHISANLRTADAVEVMASGGFAPATAISVSVKASTFATVATAAGEPFAVFGLVKLSLLTGTGIPWLLGTDLIDRHRREFWQHSVRTIDEMLTVCPRLINHVHAENRKSIRWLKHLGFTIEPARPFGRNGELFHKFHLEKHNV